MTKNARSKMTKQTALAQNGAARGPSKMSNAEFLKALRAAGAAK